MGLGVESGRFRGRLVGLGVEIGLGRGGERWV